MTRKLTIAIVFGALAVFFGRLHADPPPNSNRTVEAERFVITGANGKVIACIGAMPEGYPGIAITFGEDPKASITMLKMNDSALAITMQGPGGGTRAGLLLSEREALLEMNRGTTKTARAGIGFEKDGTPFVRLINDAGKSVFPVPPNIQSQEIDTQRGR